MKTANVERLFRDPFHRRLIFHHGETNSITARKLCAVQFGLRVGESRINIKKSESWQAKAPQGLGR